MHALKRLLAVALVSLAMMFGSTGLAHAAPSDPYAGLKAEMTKYGVSTATQQSLIAKLKAGQVWDSLKVGASPLKTSTSVVGTDVVVVEQFADGSLIVLTSPYTPPEASQGGTASVSPMSVGGCSYSGGSYWYAYTGCLSSMSILIAQMQYRFDYQGGGSTSSIINYYSLSYYAFGAVVTDAAIYRITSSKVQGGMNVHTLTGTVYVCLTTWTSGTSANSNGNC